MSTPYVGEIRLFGGNFAPVGWAFCDGSLVPISENETLFNLIGTTYGGDGEQYFALPDLRGRVPVHTSFDVILGQTGGAEEVTLTAAQIPNHTHPLQVSSTAASSRSAFGVPATTPSDPAWVSDVATDSMGFTTPAGGSQPHTNMQPYLGLSYIIALFGIYPSQT